MKLYSVVVQSRQDETGVFYLLPTLLGVNIVNQHVRTLSIGVALLGWVGIVSFNFERNV